jgi:hypothetical protein
MTSSLLKVVVTTQTTPICDDLTLVVNCEFVLYCNGLYVVTTQTTPICDGIFKFLLDCNGLVRYFGEL